MKNLKKSYKKYKHFYFVKSVFKDTNKNNFDKIKFTKESLYSVSKVNGAKFLYKMIKKIFKTTLTLILTDATANIGSDSIFLSDYFKSINSIELKKENYEALTNNVKVLKKKNINVYNEDSNILLPSLKQDIIYVDAPWGGPDYKLKKKVELYLGEKEIMQFYFDNKKLAKLFIFKVPNNYKLSNIKKVTSNNYKIYSYEKKYLLIFIRNIL